MDWKELKKSDKIFMLGNLQDYLNDKISLSEYSENQKDYIVECPYCVNAHLVDPNYKGEYHKRKLYIKKDGTVGFCFRCDRIFIDKDKGSYEIDSIRIDYAYYEETNKKFIPTKLSNLRWSLDLYNSLPDYNEIGVNYLINKRHKYMKDLYKILRFKFMDCNPVIPFFYKGELIYYQIRYLDNSRRYFSPPIDNKPAYVIERKDIKKFIICEGVFDAIACLILYQDRIPFAILGSSITDYQVNMLRSYLPLDILIYLDETKLSKRIADRLTPIIDYAEINIVESNGEDPEEKLKKLL